MTERTTWFLDTEFNEDGKTIELISIALVCEDGREYYACNSEFNPNTCQNDWVNKNVVPHLPLGKGSHSYHFEGSLWKTRAQIATEIRKLVLSGGERPRFVAYFADYDWVALCQLYGPMVALPEGFPMFCLDLKQVMAEHGIKKENLPPQLGAQHSALEDARWVRDAWREACLLVPHLTPAPQLRCSCGLTLADQTEQRRLEAEQAAGVKA